MKLIVFDLDFTLWNAGGTWCDHTSPPYRKIDSSVFDSSGSRITLYTDTVAILNELTDQNFILAIASRTHEPSWAQELMQLFEIGHFFRYTEIYPGSKLVHFENLMQKSGIEFNEMAFFDDETRNVEEVGSLGVRVFHVGSGVTRHFVMQSINYLGAESQRY